MLAFSGYNQSSCTHKLYVRHDTGDAIPPRELLSLDSGHSHAVLSAL